MTGYVVHYRYGLTNMTQSVPPSSAYAEIPNLNECYNYTFSVEATSEHLSGMSKRVILGLGRYLGIYVSACKVHTLFCSTELPVDVTGEAVSSTVISVKWDHLRACRADSHLSANNSVLNVTVEYTAVHQTKELCATASEALLVGLTPFTNYTIKVAIVNMSGDVGPYSYPITVQTPEDGKILMFA